MKEDTDEWTYEEIATAYNESGERMTAILDHLADNPGKSFAVQELADLLDVDKAKVRGVLGAFGHRIHSRYGRDTWPLEHAWDGVESTSFYAMSPEVASVINALH